MKFSKYSKCPLALFISVLFFSFINVIVHANTLSDSPVSSNDVQADAIDVTSLFGSCSQNGTYDNLTATTDPTGNSYMYHNVWFKFTAPAGDGVTIKLNANAGADVLSNGTFSVHDAQGTLGIASTGVSGDYAELSLVGLTQGATYYISVGSRSTSGAYKGSFDLCLESAPTFDQKEGALNIDALMDDCSQGGAYSNKWAITDPTGNSNMYHNVWFKFTAPAGDGVTIKLNANAGTEVLSNGTFSVHDAQGTLGIASTGVSGDYAELSLIGLTEGATYYISVGSRSTSGAYKGSFDLCLESTPTFDQKEGALNIDALMDDCSQGGAYSNRWGITDPTGNSNMYHNVWFKFTAPAGDGVTIKLNTNAGTDVLSNGTFSVHDSQGTLGIASTGVSGDHAELSLIGLTEGATYYISVGSRSTSGAYKGSFDLCLESTPSFDHKEGAVDLTSLQNSCTADAAYSNAYSSYSAISGMYYDVWFKVTVPASGELTVRVLTGGDKGTMTGTRLQLEDAAGNVQGNFNSINGVAERSWSDLAPGEYYLAVGNYVHTAARGTFTICIDPNATFDHKAGAVDLTSLQDGCTADAAYSTAYSSYNAVSGMYYDVWFKVTVPASGELTLRVLTGGDKGTLNGARLHLEDAAGNAQGNVNSINGVAERSWSGLTPGEYYLAVGNYVYTAGRGTFTICIDSTSTFDHKSGAVDLTSIQNSCTTDASYSNAYSSYAAVSGMYYDVWFKVLVTESRELTIRVLTGGTKGDMTGARLHLEDAAGNALGNFNSSNGVAERSWNDLNPGEYYLAVGNYVHTARRGTFTICIESTSSFDHKAGALDLTSTTDDCTADAAYSNAYSSYDAVSGMYYDVWFKVPVTDSRQLTVRVLTGGTKGDMTGARLHLEDAAGNALGNLNSTNGVAERSWNDLEPGDYYLAVGSYVHTARRGTFTLCIESSSSFDHKEGAIPLEGDDACSGTAEYTNVMGSSGTISGLYYDVWFSVYIPEDGELIVQVLTGGSNGTLANGKIYLEDPSGTVVGTANQNGSVIEGTWSDLAEGVYHLAVGNAGYTGNVRGSFTLCHEIVYSPCLNGLWAIASGDWSDPNIWSDTEGGEPLNALPCELTTVYIKGFSVDMSNNEQVTVKRIEIQGVSFRVTQLNVEDAEINVSDMVKVSGPGAKLKKTSTSRVRVIGGS